MDYNERNNNTQTVDKDARKKQTFPTHSWKYSNKVMFIHLIFEKLSFIRIYEEVEL